MTTDDLNTQFAYGDEIRVAAGPGGMAMVMVNNRHAQAHIHLDGAHLTHFQPKGQKPVLWVSPTSFFQPGKPIRGGIPICLPWFGGRPAGQHGFARTAPWDLVSATEESDGGVTLVLAFSADGTNPGFPHRFAARYTLRLSEKLECALEVENRGVAPFDFEAALHTYFAVNDVRQTKLRGLEGLSYRESTVGGSGGMKTAEPLVAGPEIGRIYFGAPVAMEIDDGARRVSIARDGSRSTIVWNPGTARSFPDLGGEEWAAFLCVETANIESDAITLAPGQKHTLRMKAVTTSY